MLLSLFGVSSAASRVAAVTGYTVLSLLGVVDTTGFDGARLKPCPYDSNCVSSNYLEPPNRYVSPLRTVRDQNSAFTGAVRDLKDEEIVDVLPKNRYIHFTVPGTAPGSLDDIEVMFGEEGIVNLRCQARVTLPPPPFCIKKNCINGNMDQRQRLEKVAQTLGLPPADQERMQQSAKWSPIFFNSDIVPGFYDN